MKIFFCLLFFSLITTAQSQVSNHTIYFDSGKSEINKNDLRWIDSISEFIKSSNATIEIKAYCDSDGSEESNQLLSERRAAAVNKAFISNNLNKNTIKINAFGETDPAADNGSSNGKALNRRVVVSYTLSGIIQAQESKKEIAAIPVVKSKSVLPENSITEEKLEIGKTLILKNLNFEGGTAILLEQSESVLKDLLKLMQDHPTLEIEIGGHVCCGPDYELSVERARKVYNYLKGYGIEEQRMTYKGYSFDKPIASERTEAGRIANRRVEITILKL